MISTPKIPLPQSADIGILMPPKFSEPLLVKVTVVNGQPTRSSQLKLALASFGLGAMCVTLTATDIANQGKISVAGAIITATAVAAGVSAYRENRRKMNHALNIQPS